MTIPSGVAAIYHDSPIIAVPVSKCRDALSFSYSGDGWNVYAALIRQYQENPSLTYENSILKLYYERFQPQSLSETLFVDPADTEHPIVAGWPPLPWQTVGRIPKKNNCIFGPNTKVYERNEIPRTITVYKQLKKVGYQPSKYRDGYILGYYLKSDNGYRFIIASGHHRIAALGILGYKWIHAKIHPKYPRVADIKKINEWPQVRRGTYSPEQASELFQVYFAANGKERAEKLGLYKPIYPKKQR